MVFRFYIPPILFTFTLFIFRGHWRRYCFCCSPPLPHRHLVVIRSRFATPSEEVAVFRRKTSPEMNWRNKTRIYAPTNSRQNVRKGKKKKATAFSRRKPVFDQNRQISENPNCPSHFHSLSAPAPPTHVKDRPDLISRFIFLNLSVWKK